MTGRDIASAISDVDNFITASKKKFSSCWILLWARKKSKIACVYIFLGSLSLEVVNQSRKQSKVRKILDQFEKKIWLKKKKLIMALLNERMYDFDGEIVERQIRIDL